MATRGKGTVADKRPEDALLTGASPEEVAEVNAALGRLIAEIDRLNERKEQDNREIERDAAETRAILRQIDLILAR